MFTGIIEEKGKLLSIRRAAQSATLTIGAKTVLENVKTGDSIAVNGVCLTVTAFTETGFSADVMPETLRRSSLGSLAAGGAVNLERALPAQGRFGGHLVTGHVDGMGKISAVRKEGNALLYTIAPPPVLLRYVAEKGSVALDGISLTVAKVTGRDFTVSVIPHTAAVTTLAERRAGDSINIETDILAKYTEKLLSPQKAESGITKDFLLQYSFL